MTWTRAEDDDLGAIFEAVARPWPAALARLWLRHAEGAATYSRSYWLPKDCPAQIVASMQRRDSPGRRALAHVAGWGEKQARTVLELGAWRDPFAAPAIEGPALGQPGARVGARVGPGLGDKSNGSTIVDGPALGQPGARVGARVGPDRARVSLDPNPNPEPKPGEAAPDPVPSPPPAEPSGSPADIWAKDADLAENSGLSEMETPAADPEAWRDSEVFDAIEQIESPDPSPRSGRPLPSAATTPTPSPPPSASPAARPRGLSGEGAPEPVSAPQSAPIIFGRTDAASTPSEPAKAPPRARKAQASTKAADALAVYAAWRVHHPRAAEAPTPGTLRALGSLLTEAGGLDGALLLMEWAHVGTCERARQLRGEHPWPDGRRTVYTDLGSLSRHVASRLEMAHDWKDKSTDKASGLNVIHLDSLPRGSARGPDRISAISRLLQQEYQNADY